MLDEVLAARALRLGIGQQAANHVELVVARPDLSLALPAGFFVLRLNHLRVVLQYLCHAFALENLPPEVVCLDAARVGRIAGTLVPAPVEGEEP